MTSPVRPAPKIVRERILAIAVQSGIVVSASDGTECHYDEAELPALVIAPRGAPSREYTSREKRLVTREYQALFLVKEICNDNEAEQLAALDAVWDIIEDLPDYFADFAPQLQLKDINNLPHGLPGVWNVEHVRDDGPQFTSWGDSIYACASYIFPVTTNRAK